ncbi:MAG: AsmA-like C-terminal domain-containing protein, partial [Thermodesulfobacteriota bacterium]
SDLGLLSGDIIYMMKKDSPLLFETDLKLKNLQLEKFIAGFGVKEKFLSGNLNSTIKLSSKRGAGKSGLNGDISILSEDGRLWKFIVISKIFSIVNILSIDQAFTEGLDYDNISGTFKVIDGIASTEDFLFESRSLRMSAIADLDIDDASIDSTLGFHPFVTVDSIVSKIPLAGWIITGDKKSMLSMYYTVKGPLKDPDVTPIPVKSIGKNVFGILQRVIEAPIRFVLPEGKYDEERRLELENAEKNGNTNKEEKTGEPAAGEALNEEEMGESANP